MVAKFRFSPCPTCCCEECDWTCVNCAGGRVPKELIYRITGGIADVDPLDDCDGADLFSSDGYSLQCEEPYDASETEQKCFWAYDFPTPICGVERIEASMWLVSDDNLSPGGVSPPIANGKYVWFIQWSGTGGVYAAMYKEVASQPDCMSLDFGGFTWLHASYNIPGTTDGTTDASIKSCQ